MAGLADAFVSNFVDHDPGGGVRDFAGRI